MRRGPQWRPESAPAPALEPSPHRLTQDHLERWRKHEESINGLRDKVAKLNLGIV
jgi:hypothetical protein